MSGIALWRCSANVRPAGRTTRRWPALVLLLGAGLFPSIGRAAGTESILRGHDLVVTVDSRWPGCAHGGYLPIRMRVTNTARERDLVFEFRSSSNSGDDARLPTVRRAVHIEQNASQQLSLAIPMASRDASGRLQVYENGRALENMSTSINLPDAQVQGIDRPSLLVISPSNVDCDRFEDAVNAVTGIAAVPASGAYWGGSSGPTRTSDHQVLPPQLLPESWIDYTGLDIVAVSLDTFGKISAAARAAVVQWVESGGTLIIYQVGQPAAQSKDLARLLDFDNRPPMSRIWHDAVPGLHRPLPVVAPPTGPGTVVMPPGAVAIPAPMTSTGEVALNPDANKSVWPVESGTFSRMDLLAGQVFAFPANPFPGAPVDWGWWLNTARINRLAWTARMGSSSRTKHSEFFQFLIPGVGGVPVFAFLTLITLFALAIGPVNYWLMWKRKQLYMLVVSIPAIAFATSCALFAYGLVADGFGVRSRLRSVTLLDQHAKTAVSFNRVTLYAGITPSSGLNFSPDTAVLPVWPDHSTLTGGVVDWTGGQHLASGWLKARTQTQFATIAHRPERGRLEFKPVANGLEVSNGLTWDFDALAVKDPTGTLFFGSQVPAGGSAVLHAPTPDEVSSLAVVLDDNALLAPPGVTGDDYGPFQGRSRRMMYLRGYYGSTDTPTQFAGSVLETRLSQLRRPAADPTGGGMLPQTYLGLVRKNPGIETGVERTTEYGGVHAIVGYY